MEDTKLQVAKLQVEGTKLQVESFKTHEEAMERIWEIRASLRIQPERVLQAFIESYIACCGGED